MRLTRSPALFLLLAVCAVCAVVRGRSMRRRVVHPALSTGGVVVPRGTPSRLLGGAPLLPGITVRELSAYPIQFGDYTSLYDDDCLFPLSLGCRRPDAVESAVCVLVPLHLIAPYVPSTLRVSLGACLPSIYSIRNVSISTLRADAARLCCASDCIQVYVVLRRPANSVVNPFHIDRGNLVVRTSSPCPLAVAPPLFPSSDDIAVPLVAVRQFTPEVFPPTPLSIAEHANIVNDWCSSISAR